MYGSPDWMPYEGLLSRRLNRSPDVPVCVGDQPSELRVPRGSHNPHQQGEQDEHHQEGDRRAFERPPEVRDWQSDREDEHPGDACSDEGMNEEVLINRPRSRTHGGSPCERYPSGFWLSRRWLAKRESPGTSMVCYPWGQADHALGAPRLRPTSQVVRHRLAAGSLGSGGCREGRSKRVGFRIEGGRALCAARSSRLVVDPTRPTSSRRRLARPAPVDIHTAHSGPSRRIKDGRH